jgi:hypothetical protein
MFSRFKGATPSSNDESKKANSKLIGTDLHVLIMGGLSGVSIVLEDIIGLQLFAFSLSMIQITTHRVLPVEYCG